MNPDPTDRQQNLRRAVEHLQAGRLPEAEDACRQILLDNSDDAEALHLLGLIVWNAGRHADSVNLLRRALSLNPASAEAHFHLANALRETGELDEAVAAYRQTVAIKATLPDAHFHLANCLRARGELDEAIAAYLEAVAFNPNFRQAWINLAVVLRESGKLDDALEASRQAVVVDPQHPNAHFNLGDTLKAMRRLGESIGAYRQAISLDPANAAYHRALANSLELQDKIPEAIAAYKAAQERAPASTVGLYELAALGAGEPPPATPREFVVRLFDDYSGKFDEHLARLEYRGPQLLLDAVTAAAPPTPLDIVDLGCGTGMCGALFRSMARRQVGIDISTRMLRKSYERGVYDELIVGDVTQALWERPQSADLILAADVFIYVGRLEEVFNAAAAALRCGGLLAFTIETSDSGDYVLRRSRRYAQSAAYIRRLAIESGLTEVSATGAVLRKEQDAPIEGMVFVLRRPAN